MNRAIFVLIILLLAIGCSNDKSTSPQDYQVEYQIGVDSIKVPESIEPTEELVIALYGVIGVDGSYSYDRMEITESSSGIELTAFGIQDQTPGRLYTQLSIVWYGREFVKMPPHEGPISVIFHQPDGTSLEETVLLSPSGSGI